METKYYIESRINSEPTKWRRHNYFHYSERTAAENHIQECIARLKKNGETNYKASGIRVLEYRVAQVSTTIEKKEDIISTFLVQTEEAIKQEIVEAKQEELQCIEQMHKYASQLECIYTAGRLEDHEKAWQIRVSLTNIIRQRINIKEEIEALLK